MLKTQSLSFSYDESHQFVFPDIKLTDNNSLLILGESGIGKTTLMHLLAGLLRPQTGSIQVMDKEFSKLSDKALDRFRGKNIGLVFQRPHFIKALSLKENLEMVLFLAKINVNQERIKSVSKELGLDKLLNKKPHLFSQGEQQRAAIALAVINNPSVILADEPTANLDDKNCQRVVKLLNDQAVSNGAKLVIITHDKRLKDQFQNSLTL